MVLREAAGRAERRGPARAALTAREVAEAAGLADVAVALCLAGYVLPLGAVLIAMAVAPMAALGARHRLRALAAGAVAGVATSLLVGGTGVAVNLASCAVLGGLVGVAARRGWTRRRTVLAAIATLWPVATAAAVAVLLVFAGLRSLLLRQAVNQWRGMAHFVRAAGLRGVAHLGDLVVAWLVSNWALSVATGLLVATAGSVWLAYTLAIPVLRRLPPAADPSLPLAPGEPGPLPVGLEEVSFRYPGAADASLIDVSVRIDPGDFVAVVGRNGSGKSTLARVLAGLPPTSGDVRRPGVPGLGRDSGTGFIFQRPETQVLGVRVRDDVVWGLTPGHGVDVPGLLAQVGLAGMGDRETATLSGGELQRLALAAALARRPALLLSDETTAMVDPEGRGQLVSLLRGLAAEGAAVVHVTHRPEEATAHRRLEVHAGRLREAPPATVTTLPATDGPRAAPCSLRPTQPADARVRLSGVGHVYSDGSPWAHRALAGVDLSIDAGESVFVIGRNGSGKSTLAWILAGLLVPSEGAAELEGVPLDRCIAAVGLAFQHARLQLLRSTVRADVKAAAGVGDAAADAALRLVGLDPAIFAHRRVDELSGGEQRRAALAGLLAGRPRLLVLDEPFAGLDREGRESLIDVLGELRRTQGTTLVVVSHDTEDAGRVAERVITLEGGRIVGDGPASAPAVSPTTDPASCAPDRAPTPSLAPDAAAPAAATARKRRRPAELRVFRRLPGDSVMHRLWAGTKLLALLALAVTLSARPEWRTLAVMGALLAAGLAAGRVPRGAFPRLPRWLWISIALSAVFPLFAGGAPLVHVAGMRVGLGGIDDWARVTTLTVIVLLAAALVSWTTPVAGIAPAVRTLGRPLSWLRLPVDEWATTVGLAFRCVPLLLDEIRIVSAVVHQRLPHQRQRARPPVGQLRRHAALPQQLLLTVLVVALRRASELAAAIDARGGFGAISDGDTRPSWRDAVALAVVGGAVLAALVI